MLSPDELDRLCVVLVNSRNSLNIGAAARAMSNFGFARLRVVAPYDLAFREARSAVDAEPVMRAAKPFERLEEAVADCSIVIGTDSGEQRHPEEPLNRLEAGAQEIRGHLRAGERVAILFGSEKVGLSNDDLNHCHRLLRIPTRAEHRSMNLGQGVAVVLYELIRQSEPMPPAEATMEPLATSEERERLSGVLLEALSFQGFAHDVSHAAMEQKVRRLVRRATLTRADLDQWLGLMRQLLWKLRPGPRD